MDTSFKKTVLSLPTDKHGMVCSLKSLTWTPDDKLIICCPEKLLIINVVLTHNSRFPSDQDIITTVTEDVITVPYDPECFLPSEVMNFEISFMNLKDVERQKIMSDPALVHGGFLQFSGNRILKKAVCSPFCASFGSRRHYLISCVTYEYRVFILTKEGQTCQAFECTHWIKKHILSSVTIPLTVKSKKELDNYIDLMYNMATVDVLWSQLFPSETAPFFLLMSGSRNGNVHFWKVDAEFGGKEKQFVWQFTDEYQSEVMSLSWLSKGQTNGVLAVGYVDGSIRCLDVNTTSGGSVSIAVKEILADLFCDNLSVADIAFGKTSQDTEIMLACKQYFLYLYTVESTTIKFCNHFCMDAALPITSVCLRGMYGVVSPQESAVIAIEIQQSADSISVLQTRHDHDTLSDNTSAPWFCKGLSFSRSCALCFSLHTTDYLLPVFNKQKRVSEKQVLVMSVPFKFGFEEIMQNLTDPSISSKDTVLSLCVFIKDFVSSNPGHVEPAQVPDLIKSLQTTRSKRGAQVAWATLRFMKLFLLSHGYKDLEVEWISTAQEEILAERMAQHAALCLSGLSIKKSDLDSRIVTSLQKHLRPTEKASDFKVLEGAAESHSYCAICGSQFFADGVLIAKCSKGHKTILCCLSLQPCQDFSTRQCETCGACALRVDALSDSLIKKDKFMCSLCGGHLREPA